MPYPLVTYRRTDRSSDLIIRRTRPQQSFDICLFNREQAIPQFAVARQPEAIAVQAERPAHRSDKSNAADAIRVTILGGRRARVAVWNLYQRSDLTGKRRNDFIRGKYVPARP